MSLTNTPPCPLVVDVLTVIRAVAGEDRYVRLSGRADSISVETWSGERVALAEIERRVVEHAKLRSSDDST